jgi:hypothetical protein
MYIWIKNQNRTFFIKVLYMKNCKNKTLKNKHNGNSYYPIKYAIHCKNKKLIIHLYLDRNHLYQSQYQ